jgi:Uma2 family endonuclease
MHPADETRFTEDEYVALERVSKTKHEFFNGQIIAMAGGSPRHNAICANVIGALGAALRGKPCVVMTSDQAVYVAKKASYFYPDVTVVCGKAQFSPKHQQAVQNPALVVEVLSRSTEHYDLNEKFRYYRLVPSLKEFVTVFRNERIVQHWSRTEVGRWIGATVEGDGAVELPGLGVSLTLAEIYEKVELLPEEE